jgi:hypothetical protein
LEAPSFTFGAADIRRVAEVVVEDDGKRGDGNSADGAHTHGDTRVVDHERDVLAVGNNELVPVIVILVIGCIRLEGSSSRNAEAARILIGLAVDDDRRGASEQ